MTDKTISLGAPSLCGVDLRADLDATVAGVVFPFTATLTNRLPCHVSFPAIGGLYLRASGHEGSTGTAVINSADILARFVTDIQSLAELNHTDHALDMVLDIPARTTSSRQTKAVTEPPKTAE